MSYVRTTTTTTNNNLRLGPNWLLSAQEGTRGWCASKPNGRRSSRWLLVLWARRRGDGSDTSARGRDTRRCPRHCSPPQEVEEKTTNSALQGQTTPPLGTALFRQLDERTQECGQEHFCSDGEPEAAQLAFEFDLCFIEVLCDRGAGSVSLKCSAIVCF